MVMNDAEFKIWGLNKAYQSFTKLLKFDYKKKNWCKNVMKSWIWRIRNDCDGRKIWL